MHQHARATKSILQCFKVLPFPLSYSPTFFYLFNAIALSPTPAIRLVAAFNRTRGPRPLHLQAHILRLLLQRLAIKAFHHPTSFTVNVPRAAVFVTAVLLDPDTHQAFIA